MSYKVKGKAGPFIQDQRFSYDPSDATYYLETTWGGSARAIEGQSTDFRSRNLAHTSFLDTNGTGQTVQRTPIAVKGNDLESTVRYEIATEFLEQDIFRHKAVSDEADSYDASQGTGAQTFRKFCEAQVEENDASITEGSIIDRVVTHLRKGYTGFEREYIVMRRSRKIPFTGKGAPPQASILEGRFIYSTDQLGIPDIVAFSLPNLGDLPASGWEDVLWGWRRRPSQIVFQGDFIEQSSEFVLAEWSLLLYEEAVGQASW